MPALGNRNLPGKTSFTVTYTISNVDNSIYVTLNGLADKKTIISMTNHAYFNLGEPNLEKISLKLPSKSFIETRETDLIPLREREILPCLDFNRPKRILNDIDDPYLKNHRSFGIDHCFKLDSKNLSLESLKYKLEIETDFKYVQIYTDNYEDGVKMIGTEDKHYRGVAIEPQDSILNRELTEKNTPYQRYILYKFSRK
jgi:aldose 1-epimerase